ncbi:MAG: hypothetical protein Aurels2KO_53940 [Aureliella sp.]
MSADNCKKTLPYTTGTTLSRQLSNAASTLRGIHLGLATLTGVLGGTVLMICSLNESHPFGEIGSLETQRQIFVAMEMSAVVTILFTGMNFVAFVLLSLWVSNVKENRVR